MPYFNMFVENVEIEHDDIANIVKIVNTKISALTPKIDLEIIVDDIVQFYDYIYNP